MNPTPDLRRAHTRGVMTLDWLDARFSFHFGPYRAPGREHFGVLRVLNEDVIQPGTGFGMHPHQDMEIFMLPLAGTIEHRDSLGHHLFLRPGEMLKMTAGRGIQHSQMNASAHELDHHLQIWFAPRTLGAPPGIEHRRFAPAATRADWQVLVSPDGREGSLAVDQDALLLRRELAAGEEARHEAAPGRSLYVHLIQGRLQQGQAVLEGGDALAMLEGGAVALKSLQPGTQLLLFDLPGVAA